MEVTRVFMNRQIASMEEPCEPIDRGYHRLRPEIKPPSKAPGHSLGQSWHAAARRGPFTCDHLVTDYGNV